MDTATRLPLLKRIASARGSNRRRDGGQPAARQAIPPARLGAGSAAADYPFPAKRQSQAPERMILPSGVSSSGGQLLRKQACLRRSVLALLLNGRTDAARSGVEEAEPPPALSAVGYQGSATGATWRLRPPGNLAARFPRHPGEARQSTGCGTGFSASACSASSCQSDGSAAMNSILSGNLKTFSAPNPERVSEVVNLCRVMLF